MLQRLIGLAPEFDALIEILRPLVIQVNGRNERYQQESAAADRHEQAIRICNDEFRDTCHETLAPVSLARFLFAVRQNPDKRRQQCERIDPRRQDTDRRYVSEMPEGWRIGKIQCEEADDCRYRGNADGQEIQSNSLSNRIGLRRAIAQRRAQRQQDVNRIRYRERQDDDRCGSGYRSQLDAGKTGPPHADHR